jgi:iron complex outermembrane receptor protein
MAPGVQVAQVSANAWAVSAGGTNGRFANKLLVMVDGRTVYSPLLSGVFWDVQDTVLADIERIEVIRGPGAALWGANAMNGVINIITKSAAATQGGFAELSKGSQDRGTVSLRYGGQIEGLGHWRVYGKTLERDPLRLADGSRGMDDSSQQRLGWRADLTPSSRDAIAFQGELYEGVHGESAQLNRYTPPFSSIVGTRQKVSGGHILARWQRDLSASNSITVQSYFDRNERDWPAHPYSKIDTFDIDAQYRLRQIKDHDLVLGLSYRENKDQAQPSYTGIPSDAIITNDFAASSSRTRLWSALMQDDITLKPDEWTLTLGAKLEKFSSSNPKVLPNVRVLWTPQETQTFWASAGKALRTPSRTDNNGVFRRMLPPEAILEGGNMPLPGFVEVTGQMQSEEMWAYEAGWKQRLSPGLTVDASVFLNRYTNLRSGTLDMSKVRCQPLDISPLECLMAPATGQYLTLPVVFAEGFEAQTHGLEVWTDWQASRQHRVRASASYLKVKFKTQGRTIYSFDTEKGSPAWTSSLRWSYTPSSRQEWDLSLRNVGSLTSVLDQYVPGYSALDLQWSWRSSPKVQWSVSGRNLFTSRRLEYISELGDLAKTLVGPSVFMGVRVQF